MTGSGDQHSSRRDSVQARVIEIVSEHAGIAVEKISDASDLVRDLHIVGDDGYELIEAIDKEFKIDWSELDSGVIFGNEVSFGMPPWSLLPSRLNGLRYNCEMYETESKTVGDIIEAAFIGKWSQTQPVLKSLGARRKIVLKSIETYSILLLLLGTLIAATIW